MINFNENIGLNGEINLKLIDKSKNKIIYRGRQHNLIVENGKFILANLLIGNFADYEITKIGFGDGTTAAVSGDLDLEGPNKGKGDVISSNSSTSSNTIANIYWEIDYDTDIAGQDLDLTNPWIVGNPFTITEFGLFTVNDTLFNRLIWTGPDLVMDENMKLEGDFKITIG